MNSVASPAVSKECDQDQQRAKSRFVRHVAEAVVSLEDILKRQLTRDECIQMLDLALARQGRLKSVPEHHD